MDIVASNSGLTSLTKKYVELILQGYTETTALEVSGLPKAEYLRLLLEDPGFYQEVESARKLRADFWVSKIAESVDKSFDPKDVPSERLKFDKLQFLAKADNPDKYGNNSKKLDISIDLKQFKLLPPEEAIKALSSDPFAPVEAEFTEINEPKDDELL